MLDYFDRIGLLLHADPLIHYICDSKIRNIDLFSSQLFIYGDHFIFRHMISLVKTNCTQTNDTVKVSYPNVSRNPPKHPNAFVSTCNNFVTLFWGPSFEPWNGLNLRNRSFKTVYLERKINRLLENDSFTLQSIFLCFWGPGLVSKETWSCKVLFSIRNK